MRRQHRPPTCRDWRFRRIAARRGAPVCVAVEQGLVQVEPGNGPAGCPLVRLAAFGNEPDQETVVGTEEVDPGDDRDCPRQDHGQPRDDGVPHDVSPQAAWATQAAVNLAIVDDGKLRRRPVVGDGSPGSAAVAQLERELGTVTMKCEPVIVPGDHQLLGIKRGAGSGECRP